MPDEVEEVLGMSEDIEIGDWITWRDSGRVYQGQVTAIFFDVYGVHIPIGGSSSINSYVPKGESVRKIDSPTEHE